MLQRQKFNVKKTEEIFQLNLIKILYMIKQTPLC